MSDVPVNWTELREFRAVGLLDSFVLSWRLEADLLQIDLDLLLLPEHALYEEPRPSESGCIRPAILEFPHCTLVSGDGVSDEALPKAVSGLSHGRITGLRLTADGQYELSGRFGVVKIHAERPLLRIKRLAM